MLHLPPPHTLADKSFLVSLKSATLMSAIFYGSGLHLFWLGFSMCWTNYSLKSNVRFSVIMSCAGKVIVIKPLTMLFKSHLSFSPTTCLGLSCSRRHCHICFQEIILIVKLFAPTTLKPVAGTH